MINKALFLICFAMLFSVSAMASDEPTVSASSASATSSSDQSMRMSIAVNPVTLIFPWLELQLGFGITPRFRLNVTPQVMGWVWDDGDNSSFALGGTLSASFFSSDWGGWYVEPGLLYLNWLGEGGSITAGQMIGGYEHNWDSGMFVNLGLGVLLGYFKDDDGFFADEFDGFYPAPTGNILLGYKF
jgi:hypothetical protein